MTKLFKKLGSLLKRMFIGLGQFIKTRWAKFVGIIFTWVIPIVMLNEEIALVENVEAYTKVTWVGCIVLIVVLLALRKQIFASIVRLKHGIVRGILLTVYKASGYGLFLGVLWGISKLATKLYDWWLLCGISMLIGAVFYIIDECLQDKKFKQNGGADNAEGN